jgi:hypothetical protein
MKQTLISICCLLLAAVYPTAMVVEIVGIKIQRHEFKKAFRESNHELSKVETVFLSHQEYKGQQPGDEFHLGENKYDVISVRKTAEGYCIQAFNDSVEKQLEIQLAENCKANGNHPSKSKFSIHKLTLFCQDFTFSNFKRSSLNFDYSQITLKEELGFLVLPFLPPKYLC